MEVFDKVRLAITDYDYRGRGMGKADGAVVFLDGGEIGDVVEATIVKKKKRFFEGEITSYEKKSPHRVKNPCPYTNCNGCAFLSLDRKEELNWKRRRVADALSRIGDVAVAVDPVTTRGESTGYRNHMQFHVKDRKLTLYGKGGEVISIKRCLMQTEKANAILAAMQGEKWLDEVALVGIRTTRRGESMVILSGPKDMKDNLLHGAVAFAVEVGVDSLYYTKNTNPRFHYGRKMEHLYGKKEITETLAGYDYGIFGSNFFQVNPMGAEAIIEKVVSAVEPGKNVVELYAGIGTITLPLSEQAEAVVANEYAQTSVDYARKTAEDNGVTNVRYIAGAAEKIMPRIAEEEKVDVLVVDPPRAGLDPMVVESTIEANPETMIYVSCNPSTLARDLALLKEQFRIESITPIDMFPHTAAVETVALLSKLNTEHHLDIEIGEDED